MQVIDCPNGMDLEECSPIATCPQDKFCNNLCTPRCVYKPATFPASNQWLFYGGGPGFAMYLGIILLFWVLIDYLGMLPF